jgi:hypothetical protein
MGTDEKGMAETERSRRARARVGDDAYVDEREQNRGRRGYSWPPLEKGHELSVVHGAQSERRLAPIAKRMAAELLDVAPWCARPAFEPAVQAWAWAEAQCELYRSHFAEREVLVDDKDEPATGLVQWDRAEGRAAKLRQSLGLDPQSLAKLLNGLAMVAFATHDEAGLEALKREGLEIIEARQQAALEAASEEDTDE